MMRYAGFWPRFGAALIDFTVLVPLIALSFWTISASRTTALLLELPMAFAAAFYNIYFVGRWGQTIGKMVLKVRVVGLDGTEAGFRRAFYRHAVDLAFSVIISALNIYAFLSVTDHEFSLLDVDGRLNLIDEKTGASAAAITWLYFVWGMSELVVLLLNEKRRALHDYIAGTVVIYKSETTVAV
jgi:uncharacterized RDD family membrane protein YckC